MLTAILGLAGCNRQPQLSPEQQYRKAVEKFEAGELSSALELAQQGEERFSKSQSEWGVRFRVLRAEVLVWQGQSQDALTTLKEDTSNKIPPSPEVVIRQRTIQAIANTYLQNFDEAQAHLSEARSLAGNTHPHLIGEIARAEGTLFVVRNDYASADVKYHEALHASRTQRLPFLESRTLGELGVLAMLRQHYDEAVDSFLASLVIAENLRNKTLPSKLLGNLGWCYYKLGDFDRALSSFKDAEKAAGELGLTRDQQVWLDNIGLVFDERGDFASATDYYKKALNIAQGQQNKSAVAASLTNLAATALNQKHYDEAEQYNLKALELKRAIGEPDLYPLLNEARIAAGRKQYADAIKVLNKVVEKSGEDASLRWEAQSELADIYALQGNNTAAEAQFRTALGTIDKARASLKEEHRLSFMGSAERFYNDYIDFLISRGRTKEALGVAEHSRARTLAEGLRVPVNGLLEASFSPEKTAQRTGAVILSYWLKPGQSYLWAVTPRGVSLFKLPPRDEIETAAQDYRKAVMGPRDVKEAANSSGVKLYETLVAPAQSLIKPGARVIVIGDRGLNMLNFETLLVSKPQAHYWIEDTLISNASSIALLTGSVRRGGRPDRKLLLIGNPVYTGTDYPELKQAKLEVKDVGEHFDGADRQVLEGAGATPSAYVSNNPGRFAYLHFVAHGTASQASPLDSSIILSPQNDAYKLYARDIMKQPLHAELVTISACYGAGNRSYSGEGLVGLSWAFLRAGAHNVIAALWEVSDASTPELMDSLYGGLETGRDPATALRDAKLKMLHSNTVYRRPFYWGAFQVYSSS